VGFVNLQVRSCYSLLGSTITIEALLEHARERNLGTLSLVEDGSMHSAIKFYTACKKADIRPIIGVSLDINLSESVSKWTFFAKNEAGYQALLHLTSKFALEKSVILEDILPLAQDLVVCVPANIPLPNDFFEGISNLYFSIALSQVGNLESRDRPFVFLPEVRYLEEEDFDTFRVLRAIDQNENIQNVNLDNTSHFLSVREVKSIVSTSEVLQQAVENTVKIADACHIEIPLNQRLLPKFTPPNEAEQDEYLEALCVAGAKKRYGDNINSTHYNRLKYELEVIKKMKFADYFLIVWDFIKYAKQKNILVGPGRGSAAGSIVAYALGITDVDPIEYNLLFERFLNPERISLPDIDIDFQDNRRDEVIDYVKKKYGEYSVCQIMTFGTFATRSAWRDTARIHGLSTSEINEVTKHLTSSKTLPENLKGNEELQKLLAVKKNLNFVYGIAIKIEGLPRHNSTHAAGVIISGGDLRAYTALAHGGTDVHLSQYEAGDLEAIGLLKMDFLGLRNLTMIQDISAKINGDSNEKFDINKISFEDDKTYELITRANTTGIFQLESGGMRQALRQVSPGSLEDIISCLALFRPGPMENIPSFAARKNGREQISYLHPSLVPILQNTYGIIVYQEQIMQIANVVAGYNLGEADILRRAVSKKDRHLLESERQRFVSGAISRKYDQRVADAIFALILKFADYGFNRAHAACYAVISYQMAFLKANYPLFFMAVSLSSVMGGEKSTAAYIKEAKQLGIKILPPCVNKSNLEYSVETEGIRFGLLPIKSIGREISKNILTERQKGSFPSFEDFAIRTKGFLNTKAMSALINIGAFEAFGHSRQTLHENLDHVFDFAKYAGGLIEASFKMLPAKVDLTPAEIMSREQELLGFCLQAHPVQNFASVIQDKGWFTPSIAIHSGKRNVIVTGLVEGLREIRDKNGNLMAFLEISDEDGNLDVIIFANGYKAEYRALKGHVITISGNLNMRQGKYSLALREIVAVLN